MVSLPCDPGLLAEELSRPQVATDRHRLTVEAVELLPGDQPDSGVLKLVIQAKPAPGAPLEHWQLDLEMPASMLDPQMTTHQALAVTLRANIEEWWMTKDREPHTAAWGRRLPEPPSVP
jgi:hypothetical protein